MEINKLTDEIFNRFPKVWEKLNNKYLIDGGNQVRNLNGIQICYCDLEDFFEENKIIIDIDYDVEKNNYYYYISKNQFIVSENYESKNKTKKEAKYEAIIQACIILERSLKKG